MSVKCRTCLELINGASIINTQTKVTDDKNVLQAIEEVASVKGSKDDFFPQYVCEQCFKLLKSTISFRRLIISSYSELQEKLTKCQQDIHKKVSDVHSKSVEFISVGNVPELHTDLKFETDSTRSHENPLLEESENEELKAESGEDTVENYTGPHFMALAEVSSSTEPKIKTKRIYKMRKKDVKVPKNISRICSLCGKVVKGKQNYNAHMKMHSNHIPPLVYVCPVCPKQFSQKKYLLVHRRSHTGEKPFHCDICNKNFSQFASFYVHKRRLHDKVVQGTCSYCGKKFVDKPELDVHIKMWHTETPEEANVIETVFQCTTCSQYFDKKCALLSHEKCCTKIIKCEKCNKIFQRMFNLNRHQTRCSGQATRAESNYCCLCNFESPTKLILEDHYNSRHDAGICEKACDFQTWEEFVAWKNKFEIETKSRFTSKGTSCTQHFKISRYYCHRGGRFKPKGRGIRHTNLLGSSKINGHCPAKIIASVNESGTVKVIYCDTHIGHKCDTYIGYNIENGERPYLCEFCSAAFVCNRTLQRHRRELHSEKKPCQKCGKMLGDYALKKHLVRHQVIDEGLQITRKKYTCEYCKTVMNFTSRRRHLEKQHGIKLYGRGDDCKEIPIKKETTESA